jgi:hypothetical protein
MLAGSYITLSPPGAWVPNAAGKGSFETDPKQVWYYAKNKDHRYEWVDSKDAEAVPFSVNYGASYGLPAFIGRISLRGRTFTGNVIPAMKLFYYVNENGDTKSTTTGYQVLTCKSHKSE